MLQMRDNIKQILTHICNGVKGTQPLRTGVPGAPVVKAHQALVTALQLPQYGCHGPVKRWPEAYRQWPLPGT